LGLDWINFIICLINIAKEKMNMKKIKKELKEFEEKEGIKSRLNTKEAIIEPLAIFSAFVLGEKALKKL